MSTSVQEPKLLRIRTVAERLDTSEKLVRRAIERGELPAVRLGGPGSSIRVDPDDLQVWLEEHLVAPKDDR